MKRLVLLLVMVGLGGCSQHPASESSQVMARVNDNEITLQQLEDALGHMGESTKSSTLRKELAGKLVDRELAMQQAIKDKLDRKPEVMRQIEEARRDLLARAYAQQLAMTAERPSEQQAASFYSRHPELYAKRRIYLLRMMAWPSEMAELPELRQQITEGKPLETMLAWLGEKKVAYSKQVVIRPAEDLPLAVVQRFAEAKAGESVFVDGQLGLIAYQLVSAENAPVSWDEARDDILQKLARESGRKVVDNEMRHLRSVARIEYMGEFAVTVPAKKLAQNP